VILRRHKLVFHAYRAVLSIAGTVEVSRSASILEYGDTPSHKSPRLLVFPDVNGVIQFNEVILFSPIFGVFELLERVFGSKLSSPEVSPVNTLDFDSPQKLRKCSQESLIIMGRLSSPVEPSWLIISFILAQLLECVQCRLLTFTEMPQMRCGILKGLYTLQLCVCHCEGRGKMSVS
jgi:hypothetical protein